jgi:lipoprotein-anchoring transpeptidase ErfK/SrfK
VGKTESHGCIRLTNWSAQDVAQAVKPGMTATLKD